MNFEFHNKEHTTMFSPKSVLITGCSDGGLGSALALAFKDAGWRVFASVRNTKKLQETKAAGIESIQLDVSSQESISAAVLEVSKLAGGSLDALVNNAGAGYSMPQLDLNIQKVRDVFELNVFSNIAMVQAFAPLLIRSTHGAMVINNSSIASVLPLPIQSAYNASKAAASMFTACLRLELEPLGIKVIELKTGAIRTNFASNNLSISRAQILPEESYYNIAKEAIEKFIIGEWLAESGSDRHEWAKQIVNDVSHPRPAYQLWRGASASRMWFGTMLPSWLFDRELKQRSGLAEMEQKIAGLGGLGVLKMKVIDTTTMATDHLM
jgi:NAD(P)-dependent dehydrogenase (short-subunit alcohol dehydrogenase family)